MGRGLLVGRLFGTDIYCELSFFLLIGLYIWQVGPAAGAIFSAAVVVSILVHEFGHVLAVRGLLRTECIVVLWILGGLCMYRGAPRPGQQATISLAGPAFSFALGGLCYGVYKLLAPASPLLVAFLLTMTWINLIWTFANLLPALPLDGGKALQAGLRAFLRRDKADRLMQGLSLVTGVAIVAVAYHYRYTFAAMMGIFLVLDNLKPRGIAYH
jgi:Zn-dependent protease